MRGDSGAAGEGRVVGVLKFHSWGKCTMPNEYQLRLDVQHFLWPVYYIGLYYIIYGGPLSCILGCNYAGPLSCILECNKSWVYR